MLRYRQRRILTYRCDIKIVLFRYSIIQLRFIMTIVQIDILQIVSKIFPVLDDYRNVTRRIEGNFYDFEYSNYGFSTAAQQCSDRIIGKASRKFSPARLLSANERYIIRFSRWYFQSHFPFQKYKIFLPRFLSLFFHTRM